MKKLLALTLVLTMLLSMVPAVFAANLASEVTVNLSGTTEATVDDTQLVYTVGVSGAEALATATINLDINGLVRPVAEGVNGRSVLAQELVDGELEVVIFNTAGLTGAGDILTVTGETDRFYHVEFMGEMLIDKYTGDIYRYYNGLAQFFAKFDPEDPGALMFAG